MPSVMDLYHIPYTHADVSDRHPMHCLWLSHVLCIRALTYLQWQDFGGLQQDLANAAILPHWSALLVKDLLELIWFEDRSSGGKSFKLAVLPCS